MIQIQLASDQQVAEFVWDVLQQCNLNASIVRSEATQEAYELQRGHSAHYAERELRLSNLVKRAAVCLALPARAMISARCGSIGRVFGQAQLGLVAAGDALPRGRVPDGGVAEWEQAGREGRFS